AAPDGSTIVLQEHDGQFYLRINGTPLMSTTAFASEVEMASIACEKLKATNIKESRVLIGGLGFGFTLRRVLDLARFDAAIDVAELLPEIIDWNRLYLRDVNGRLLEDPRVTIQREDVFELIRPGGLRRESQSYHAILLDVDNSPDPLVQSGNARLYSRSGLESIKNALHPGGRVVFWSANQDHAFEDDLRKVFSRTESVAAKAYATAKRYTHTLFVADRS
ncbi:MAG: hypothetical protein RIF32_04480, partial [Leptospirales bacterium]